MHNTVALKEY